jgi:hypothetical protein
MASESVIHCFADADSIAKAIRFALSDEGASIAGTAYNPYCKPNTLQLMVDAIATTPLEAIATKRFIDHK